MDDERYARLEQRIHVLERLVRTLIQPGAIPPQQISSPTVPTRVPLRERIAEKNAAEERAGRMATLPRVPATAEPSQSAEQWVGSRGVLVVGVGLVILAAVFGLSWAIEHGLISPAVRCSAGVVFGIATAAIGWRQYHRDLHRYGAALIGTGCAVIYLSIWAAGNLYGLIPPVVAIQLLDLLSLALAGIAYRLKEEILGVIGAVGALFAPALISTAAPAYTFTLGYLLVVAFALGGIAVRQQWRTMANVVLLGFFVSAIDPASRGANPWMVLVSAMAAGLLGLYYGDRFKWAEITFAAFLGGWLFVGAAETMPVMRVVGGVLLTAPVLWWAYQRPRTWPDPRALVLEERWGFVDSVTFYLSPVLLLFYLERTSFVWFGAHPGAALIFIAIPYLIIGYARNRVPFTLLGVVFSIAGTTSAWSGTDRVWPLLLIAVVTAALDKRLARRDGRWYALIAVGCGLFVLPDAFGVRLGDAAAFLDAWALAVWGCIAVVALFAGGLWTVESDEQPTTGVLRGDLFTPAGLSVTLRGIANAMQEALWVSAGVLLLAGVSVELARLMGQLGFLPETAGLAAGLAVSAWWACYAGGLVYFGFRRGITSVRVAGLLVAAAAVAKVILFDLAELSSLYRVASFLILGIVLLGVAFLYHRQRRNAADLQLS